MSISVHVFLESNVYHMNLHSLHLPCIGFEHQGLFNLKERSFFFKLAKQTFWVNEITSADKAKQM